MEDPETASFRGDGVADGFSIRGRGLAEEQLLVREQRKSSRIREDRQGGPVREEGNMPALLEGRVGSHVIFMRVGVDDRGDASRGYRLNKILLPEIDPR